MSRKTLHAQSALLKASVSGELLINSGQLKDRSARIPVKGIAVVIPGFLKSSVSGG
ncbi:MAG: hypothetical protein ACNY01_03850 [Desulfobacteria bacterium]